MPKLYTRVVFVGKVSDGGQDRVAVAHRHKIVHLVPYVEIHLPEHVHGPPPPGKYRPALHSDQR